MGGAGKGGAKQPAGAAKAVPAVGLNRRITRTKKDEETKKAPPAPPALSRPDVSRMLGFLDYHGNRSKTKEPSCVNLLEYYHTKANAEDKRLMLQSFVSAPGKPMKWAKDFHTEEIREDKEQVITNEHWFNR